MSSDEENFSNDLSDSSDSSFNETKSKNIKRSLSTDKLKRKKRKTLLKHDVSNDNVRNPSLNSMLKVFGRKKDVKCTNKKNNYEPFECNLPGCSQNFRKEKAFNIHVKHFHGVFNLKKYESVLTASFYDYESIKKESEKIDLKTSSEIKKIFIAEPNILQKNISKFPFALPLTYDSQKRNGHLFIDESVNVNESSRLGNLNSVKVSPAKTLSCSNILSKSYSQTLFSTDKRDKVKTDYETELIDENVIPVKNCESQSFCLLKEDIKNNLVKENCHITCKIFDSDSDVLSKSQLYSTDLEESYKNFIKQKEDESLNSSCIRNTYGSKLTEENINNHSKNKAEEATIHFDNKSVNQEKCVIVSSDMTKSYEDFVREKEMQFSDSSLNNKFSISNKIKERKTEVIGPSLVSKSPDVTKEVYKTIVCDTVKIDNKSANQEKCVIVSSDKIKSCKNFVREKEMHFTDSLNNKFTITKEVKERKTEVNVPSLVSESHDMTKEVNKTLECDTVKIDNSSSKTFHTISSIQDVGDTSFSDNFEICNSSHSNALVKDMGNTINLDIVEISNTCSKTSHITASLTEGSVGVQKTDFLYHAFKLCNWAKNVKQLLLQMKPVINNLKNYFVSTGLKSEESSIPVFKAKSDEKKKTSEQLHYVFFLDIIRNENFIPSYTEHFLTKAEIKILNKLKNPVSLYIKNTELELPSVKLRRDTEFLQRNSEFFSILLKIQKQCLINPYAGSIVSVTELYQPSTKLRLEKSDYFSKVFSNVYAGKSCIYMQSYGSDKDLNVSPHVECICNDNYVHKLIGFVLLPGPKNTLTKDMCVGLCFQSVSISLKDCILELTAICNEVETNLSVVSEELDERINDYNTAEMRKNLSDIFCSIDTEFNNVFSSLKLTCQLVNKLVGLNSKNSPTESEKKFVKDIMVKIGQIIENLKDIKECDVLF